MKKISTLTGIFMLLTITFTSCDSNDDKEIVNSLPEAVMEPVIFNFTSTWNSACGDVSRPVMDSIRLNYPNTVIISAHLDEAGGSSVDPLSNDDSEGLASFFNVYSQEDSLYSIPYLWFIVDGFIGGFNRSGISYDAISSSIDWAKDMKYPAIAMDIIPEVTGNQLNLAIKTEAKNYFTMPVYISTYLTEDQVSAEQVNDSGLEKNIHNDVLRDCLNEYNGDKIADNLATGDKGEYHYSAQLNEAWNKNNMKVNVTIWYKDQVYGNLVHLGKRADLISD
jgi:hypothetical protein